jgi:hypothetical protein
MIAGVQLAFWVDFLAPFALLLLQLLSQDTSTQSIICHLAYVHKTDTPA